MNGDTIMNLLQPNKLIRLAGALSVAFASNAAISSTGGLEEIVVTAQKRAESLQDVPISISAVTGETLASLGINRSDDLSIVTPNLQQGRQLASATPFLRGVGTKNSSPGDESSVSTYVDGVYYASMISSVASFNNIERVEVLRGPQGTLFGRNATGGLIHIITKDPQQDFQGQASLGYGNYETAEAKLYLTGGLSETVAADLSLYYHDQAEGYGVNQFSGKELQGNRDLSIRSKILFDLSDKSTLLLTLSHAEREDVDGTGRQPAPGTVAIDGTSTYTGDWHDVISNVEPGIEADQQVISAIYTRQFDGLEFISTSAYLRDDSITHFDQDASATPLMNIVLDFENRQFTQEFQLASTNDDALSWVAGAYFIRAESEMNPTRFIQTSTDVINETTTTSYALYAQGDYSFTEQTIFTAGLRWTNDKRELDGFSRGFTNGSWGPFTFQAGQVFIPPFSVDETFKELTWRLALTHHFSDNMMGYVSYNRGFKSGVFNTFIPFGPSSAIEPEILDAYEIGFKGDFFNDRLRINGSVFFYDFTDMQLQLVQSGRTVLLNAAESEIFGSELESIFVVNDDLDVKLALSLLDSEYTKFDDGPILTPAPSGGNVLSSGDLSGNELIRAPDLTYSLAINYHKDTSIGMLNTTLIYYYNDGFFWEPDNRFQQDDYDVLSTEISLENGGITYSFYGRNLLDSEYAYYSVSQNFGDLIGAAPPRTYGFAVTYAF